MALFERFVRSENGTTAAEFALAAVGIMIAMNAASKILGSAPDHAASAVLQSLVSSLGP
jgi:Flp pilus assembly pilin Flp